MPADIIIADYGLCTALGLSAETTWNHVMAGTPGIQRSPRLSGPAPAAVCPGLEGAPLSLVLHMLEPLLAPLPRRLPPDALLLLATTVGEVDLLERSLLQGEGDVEAGRLDFLLKRVAGMLGLSRPGVIVSAACASSSVAMALGASLLSSGREADVIVVACDAVTEFVAAGFSSLMALAPEPARPFDRRRQGLSLGEAAGWCWLRAASAGEAHASSRGCLRGWSCRADAHHMTAPDPRGAGLEAAMDDALRMAGVAPFELGAVCAHGTGTRHNDDMELQALACLLASAPACPVFSIKGQVGHTLGAAGLVEAIVSLEASRAGCVPPTVGCEEPEPSTVMITRASTPITSPVVLSTNSGFGGINTALVLDARVPGPVAPGKSASRTVAGRVELAGLAWASTTQFGLVVPSGATVHALPPMDNPNLLFPDGYPNWGRVGLAARRLACVLELALREPGLGVRGAPLSSWGLLGLNATGCHAENRTFFEDYLAHGRSLARGALFVQTLPTTPVAEATIHFRLNGPVWHLIDPRLDFSRAADWACVLLNDGAAPGLVLAAWEADWIVCAFLRVAREPAGLGWAEDIIQLLPQGTPLAWLERFGAGASGTEGME